MLRRSKSLCTHPKTINLSLSLSLSLTHTHTHTQIPVLKEDHGSVGQDFANHKSSTSLVVVFFLVSNKAYYFDEIIPPCVQS